MRARDSRCMSCMWVHICVNVRMILVVRARRVCARVRLYVYVCVAVRACVCVRNYVVCV